jgi:peroxiredoxin
VYSIIIMKYILTLLIVASYSLSCFSQEEEIKDSTQQDITVTEDATEICPILIGETLPDGTMTNLDKEKTSIHKLTESKPTIIVFYRGGWCPYCTKQLGGLNEVQEEIESLGFQVLAISPDKVDNLKETESEEELKYTLLSDATMEYARTMGIAFQLDEKTKKRYDGYGIDLKERSGENHYQLPVPAVFVVDAKGVIQFSYVNPSYNVRLNPEVLLTVLKTMK